MIIGGFQKFSLIDYPDKICAIVFTQGCNFRCPYCHNPELVDSKRPNPKEIREEEILSFLERRKEKLDAVTITGGEPLLQSDLGEFLSSLKVLGYLVKLDTNGSVPSKLERLIASAHIDYIAMDIKAPLDKYENLIRRKIDTRKILDSIRMIMDSGLDYEFRTTVVRSLLKREDFVEIGKMIKGSRLYVLQRFVLSKSLDDKFLAMDSYSDKEFNSIKNLMEDFVERCIVR